MKQTKAKFLLFFSTLSVVVAVVVVVVVAVITALFKICFYR